MQTFPFTSALRRHRVLRLPLLRGVVALGGSHGDRPAGAEHLGQRPAAAPAARGRGRGEGERALGGGLGGALVVSFAFAVGLFFVVPVGLVSLIKSQLHSSTLFWLIEGIVRTAIFLGYLLLLSRLRELRRVFEYHGAEHKTIACYEAGRELTPENAAGFSRLHPRCGTSFLLIVMIVAIFVFAPIGLPAWYWLVRDARCSACPLIAGISFEIIKLAARHRDRAWVRCADGARARAAATDDARARPLASSRSRSLRCAAVLDVEAARRAAAPPTCVGLEVVA